MVQPRPRRTIVVEDCLVSDSMLARSACTGWLPSEEATIEESIRLTVQQKAQVLPRYDKNFKIEIPLFENMVGEYAELRLRAATPACLPAAVSQGALTLSDLILSCLILSDFV